MSRQTAERNFLTAVAAVLTAWTALAGKPVELQNPAFEQVGKDGVPVGWSRHPDWHAERAGHNGSGGYVFECADAKKRRGGRLGQDVRLGPIDYRMMRLK